VRSGLHHLPDLDIHLARALAGPRPQPAAELAVSLVQSLVLAEPPALSAADLLGALDALSKLAARASGGHAVLAVVDEARRVSM
jgi:hypothetical protein